MRRRSCRGVKQRAHLDLRGVAAGSDHSAVLRPGTGQLFMFGNNSHGELGIGSTMKTNKATAVVGVAPTNLVCGRYHTLALQGDGSVWAWGDNVNGQLGLRFSLLWTNRPARIPSIDNIASLAPGCLAYHCLAMAADGALWAWGDNYYGQLGIGSRQTTYVPVRVIGQNDVAAAAVGLYHSLLVKSDGTVWATGANEFGQLGLGEWPYRERPVQTVLYGTLAIRVTPQDASWWLSSFPEGYAGPDHGTGDMAPVTNAPAGGYEIQFNPLPGYRTPRAQAHVLTDAESLVVTATYGRAMVANDYDGDGASELAVYDNTSGAWYAYSLQSGQATVWGRAWGWSGAETVPGDYDGDAYSDMAVYDQGAGCWYIWSEARQESLLLALPWGWPGAETVPGDYDGDGAGDLAVYDQASGYWYITTVGGTALAWERAWGWPGATTVPGDYDGDKVYDLCVYDGNTGYWYVQTLADPNGSLAWAQAWGWPGATTVPGDYDGDGKDDMAVYDQPTGAWYVWSQARMQSLIWAEPWGWTGAVPVPGDYDGDGVSDLAVFDTTTGNWFIWSDAQGRALAWAQSWGWPGAWPVGAL